MTAHVQATSSGGSTSYVIDGDTAEEIREAIEAIERNYNPWGYGTAFAPPKQQPDGRWVAYGSRANSCD